jgi:hypothetical protein
LQIVQYIYFELIKSCYARLYELTGIVIVRYISIDGKKPIENFSSIMKVSVKLSWVYTRK